MPCHNRAGGRELRPARRERIGRQTIQHRRETRRFVHFDPGSTGQGGRGFRVGQADKPRCVGQFDSDHGVIQRAAVVAMDGLHGDRCAAAAAAGEAYPIRAFGTLKLKDATHSDWTTVPRKNLRVSFKFTSLGTLLCHLRVSAWLIPRQD